jgi:transcription initiation factor TFIID subunit 6
MLMQLHQLMPSILTCLIAKRLGDPSKASKEHYALRDFAASILSLVLERFGNSYSTLKPRLCRSLLRAFLDNHKPITTHYGAITGLRIMGREVVRTIVLPNLKIYTDLILKPVLTDVQSDNATRHDAEKCLDAIMVDNLYG